MAIDYDGIKRRVTMEMTVAYLGLKQSSRKGDQARYLCPVCKGDDELSINLVEAKYQCFRCHKSSRDVIALVAFIKRVRQSEAAMMLDNAFPEHRAPSPTKVEPDGRREPELDTSHEAIGFFELSAATLAALEAGYDEQSKRLLIPLRLPDGKHVGYLGFATEDTQKPLIAFPADLEEKCGAQKPAAQVIDIKSRYRIA